MKIRINDKLEVDREDIIDGLWSAYRDSVTLAKQDDPTTVGFPELEAVLDWINENGLPRPEEPA
jgi:hypothetical protein